MAVTAPPAGHLATLARAHGVLIAMLKARNGELASRNSQLEARVAELEERLARLERAV